MILILKEYFLLEFDLQIKSFENLQVLWTPIGLIKIFIIDN